MALASLSHYRIEAELGRGGMGIVYRAFDTELDRVVALKVLPPHALASADDRARFQREAKAAARLHHPHIASVFAIGEAPLVPEGAESPGAASSTTADVRPFIAMEFVDGESLASRIARGPLKLEEAVRLAAQIAQALGAAHEAGIVHRDVKSGNVMLTAKGEAKVLDFGLAQTAASTKLTRLGSTLGTVAYMSPEQARGEEVDGRSDLWSVGVALYEMIAGRLPFVADYEQATLYGILNQDPEPLTAVRTGVPMELEGIVGKLLRKEARLRYQTAADLLADLETVAGTLKSGSSAARSSVHSAIRASAAGLDATPAQAPAPDVPSRQDLVRTGTARWRRYALWFGFVGLLSGSLATATLLRTGRSTGAGPTGDVVRSTILLPPDMPLQLVGDALGSQINALDLSADGSMLVYSARTGADTRLVLRDMRTATFRRLEETTGARNPSFSPDGRSIAYISGNGVYRVSVDGGRPEFVTENSDGGGMRWGRDGMIYVVDLQGKRVVRVTPEGEREDLIPDGSCGCAMPSLAPGRFGPVVSGRDQEWVGRIVDGRIDTTTIRGNHATFHEAGFVLYARTGVLMASRWDPSTGAIGTEDLPVVDSLRTGTVMRSGHYAVSSGGTLVYARGAPPGIVNLVIREADGSETPIPLPPGVYGPVDLSPDERRLLVTSYDAGGKLVIADLVSGSRQFVAPDAEARSAIWASDAESIVYSRRVGDRWEIVRVRTTGSGEPERIAEADVLVRPSAMSSDGRWLAYERQRQSGLVVRNLSDGSETVISEPGISYFAADFTPDGRFVAYTKIGAQGSMVAVAPVPPTGEEWIVSAGDGEEPEWLPDRDGFVFRRSTQWFVVDVNPGGGRPAFSEPRLLFSGPWVNIAGMEYRMMSGSRAVLQRPVNVTETTSRIEVISDFFVELDRLLGDLRN